MSEVNFKGHRIRPEVIKSNYQRKAVLFRNKIISVLGEMGVGVDDIELEFNGMEMKKAKASVTWYFDGHMLYYENNSQDKYVENLYIVFKVIEGEVELLKLKKKSLMDFIEEFREDDGLEEKRKQAREFFGLHHSSSDIEEINKKYKDMAKILHPDMPNGDVEKFKQLNHHHKILKRELM
jgi:hypothetical protein